jgi:hypothetical protein
VRALPRRASVRATPSAASTTSAFTGFAVLGAHAQAVLRACHASARADETGAPSGASRALRRRSRAVVTCHADPHGGRFDEAQGYPAEVEGCGDCARCHDESSFRDAARDFDHGYWTGFALAGAHGEARCAACHEPLAGPSALGRTLGRGLGARCADCHEDPARRAVRGRVRVSDCARCHDAEAELRRRSTTSATARFALGEAHRALACSGCHDTVQRGRPRGRATIARSEGMRGLPRQATQKFCCDGSRGRSERARRSAGAAARRGVPRRAGAGGHGGHERRSRCAWARPKRGWALIDRGSADRLERGDVVRFFPREGGKYAGTVVELEERAARVELAGHGTSCPPRGRAARLQIPRARLRAAARARPRLRPAAARTKARPASAAARVREQGRGLAAGRAPARARASGAARGARDEPARARLRAASRARTPARTTAATRCARVRRRARDREPLRRGDRIHADAEWNDRKVDVPDDDDEKDVELRLDRLSYAWGGTASSPRAWEVGPLLHLGMAEFGVLDGAEWLVLPPRR